MNIYKKILIFIITYTLLTNIHAHEIKYKNKIISIVNNDIILKSEITKHLSSLTLLININKNKNFKKYILNDIINTKLQLKLSEKYEITTHPKEIKDVYTQFAIRNKLSLLEYNDLITSYNLTHNEINIFIKENLIIEKLHEKLLHNHLIVSRDELNNFLTLSNNNLTKYQTSSYKILKISIDRKNNNNKNLTNIIKILNILKKKNNEYKTLELTIDKKLNSKSHILVIDPTDSLNQKIKNQIIKNLEKNVIGPFYTKKHIEFIKIIENKSTINKNDIKIKVNHAFIKKNTTKLYENKIRNTKEQIQKLNKIKKSLKKNNNKNFKTEWLNDLNIPKKIHKKIIKLKNNEISNILETKDGWHIIKIIYKEYDRQTSINKKLTSQIKNNKFKKLRKNWIKNLKKEAYIKTFK